MSNEIMSRVMKKVLAFMKWGIIANLKSDRGGRL